MSDIYSRKKRAEIMASISNNDTKPEIAVRSFLFKQGLRFRKNVKELIGKPDVVLPKYGIIIFVHRCFWHGHTCNKGSRPNTNKRFWDKKIQNNMKRDKKVVKVLKKNGWTVLTIWECNLKSKGRFESTMRNVLNKVIN